MARGREHHPTDETRAFVREHIANGASQERVAAAMGLSVDTLSRKYREELDASLGLADVEVEACLGWKAKNRSSDYNACTIFYAKTRLGYRETVALDPDSKKVDLESLTDDQLREIVARRAVRDRESGSGTDSPTKVRAA